VRPIAAIALAGLTLSACHVSNRLYNPADPDLLKKLHPAEITAKSPDTPKSIVRVEQNDKRIDRSDPDCRPVAGGPVCMAFVEFDEQGEFWDRQQPERALDLVALANGRSPIVVTFTHGWKNNADDRNDHENHNVIGFEGVLDNLRAQYPTHPVIGIYLGWRGDLVPEFWPVRQQFSYFNREGTAIRIPGASLTSFLIRLMTNTHQKEAQGAHLIIVGHSFGALVMERALSQAMTDYVLRQTKGADCEANQVRADLVVFVNSAASANEGKQMLNLLKDRVMYDANGPCGAAVSGPSYPLFLSISSLGDAATRFAVPIGHGLSFLNFKLKGSWRDYDPSQAQPPSVTAQSAYYMSTTAHMEALQSHVIVDPANLSEVQRCARAPDGSVRYFGAAFSTTTGHTYRICERAGRWNDTPYWAMQMPATVVPDHSGIFNLNFLTLLKTFFLTPEQMDNPRLRPSLRPMAR
jgi:hypothetical protein